MGSFLKEVVFERRAVPGGVTQYVPIQTSEAQAAGSRVVATAELPSPEDEIWKKRWQKVRAAMESIPPASPSKLTAYSAAAPTSASAGNAVMPMSGPINTQCYNPHYNLDYPGGIRASWYPSYNFDYFTNLPNASWESLTAQGFAAWGITSNFCGWGDFLNVTASPIGTKPYWDRYDDDINIVGGTPGTPYPCGSLSSYLACTWAFWDTASALGPGGQNQRIHGFDMWIDMSFPWADGALPGYYDVVSVLAHEAGHVYGLQHVGCCNDDYDDDVVMFPTTYSNDTTHRTLAYGDTIGMHTFYP